MKWISVKKRLPHKYVNVLAISKFGKFGLTCVGSDNKLDDFELSVFLARISQNIALCKKYKVKTLFISSSCTDSDLAAFSRVLQKQRNLYK